jgi:hypothetical protein
MNRAFRTFAPALALLALLTGNAIAAAKPAGQWKVHLQGQATSEGEVHLRITPQTGEPIVVTIKIATSRGEMYMAKDLLAALKAQLPMPQYKSEIVHISDVLIKAGHGQPAFSIEFVDSSVGGTKVIVAPI